MNQSPRVEERLEWQWGERFLETCVDHAMNMGLPGGDGGFTVDLRHCSCTTKVVAKSCVPL